MNKDLAGVSAVWRALFGVQGCRFNCLIVHSSSAFRLLVKEPPKMVLRRILGPSLETGAVCDAALSGDYHRIADYVSVRAVQEKCDEKGLGAASGHRHYRPSFSIISNIAATYSSFPRPGSPRIFKGADTSVAP